MMENKYWAAGDKSDIGASMMDKIRLQREYLQASGKIVELQKSYDAYYGNVHIENINDSLKAININHYASYIRNIHSMVTSSRPAWEAQAVNTDLESQADTQLAAGLLDYYMKEKGIESKLTDSCLKALFLKEGWISLGWNATGGEVYGVNPETNEPIHEGDFEVKTHTMLDVTRDCENKSIDGDWKIVREWGNKWDFAAKYPELASDIINLKNDEVPQSVGEIGGTKNVIMNNKQDSDIIPVYTLFHKKTDAMKQGRMTKILNSDIVLFDGALPYKDIYVFPITTGVQFESAFGHSYLMDLLPVQDAFNMTVSAITTNQAANAVQNFQIPKGASPTLNKVDSGMNIWEYDPKGGKIERLDLLGTAPEVFNFASFLIQQGDLISNVSQIGRGNAPANMSGTAMALLQQQAIQSTSGVQTSYTVAMENTGSALIELLQTFAVVPRVAMIAGKSKRSMMKHFSNKDLKGIGRVFVNRANPLTKTGAGRMEIANNLLQIPGMITTPEQYLGVLTTGQLEPLYQRDNSQRMLILSENESMMEGKGVEALMTDDHATHVLEHSCVLDSPEARSNPTVVQFALAHIQEHITLAQSMQPAMAQMLKQPSFAAPPQAPPQQGAPPQDQQQIPPEGEELPGQPSPAQPPNPEAFNQGVQ